MTYVILAAVLLFMVQNFLPSWARSKSGEAEQKAFLRGARDTTPEHTILSARMKRAQENMLENIIIFLPLALLLESKGLGEGAALWAGVIWLLARAVYIVAYGKGLTPLRSLLYTVSLICMVVMGVSLL